MLCLAIVLELISCHRFGSAVRKWCVGTKIFFYFLQLIQPSDTHRVHIHLGVNSSSSPPVSTPSPPTTPSPPSSPISSPISYPSSPDAPPPLTQTSASSHTPLLSTPPHIPISTPKYPFSFKKQLSGESARTYHNDTPSAPTLAPLRIKTSIEHLALAASAGGSENPRNDDPWSLDKGFAGVEK